MFSASACFRFLAGLALALFAASAQAVALPGTFTDALRQAGIPLDHVAVVVQPVDGGAPLLSHNAEAALNPASVMKLVTSFAALDQLGPGFMWTTDVWADGALADGVLHGNLVIKGHGDPGLTLERMWLLQRDLRARGIRRIEGDLVLDPSAFELAEADPGAFDGEPLALYNATPGALVANYNATTLRLKPDGQQVGVAPDIALPGVELVSQLAIDERAPCNGWKEAIEPTAPPDGRPGVVLSGPYPRSCGEQTIALNLFGPAATFDRIFRGLWAEGGGTLTGATVEGGAPDGPPLLQFASEPLTVALTRMNKYSNNLMARNLFLTLGAAAYGPPATPDKGARAVRAALGRHGIPTRKLVLENGSGLSRIERISADALNRVLLAAYRSAWFAEFESALPVAALDGTLKRRFNGSALAGTAHLKTGTLRDVSALAGYVDGADGRRVSFVMLVNHANARRSEPAQRALLEWIEAGGRQAGGGADGIR